MEMESKQEANFSREFGSDSSATIINEAAARILGWEKMPLTQDLHLRPGKWLCTWFPDVVGVVKNFHFESMWRTSVRYASGWGTNNWSMAFKVKTTNIRNLGRGHRIEVENPVLRAPFSYQFMDDAFQYVPIEQRTGRLLTAIIAVMIARVWSVRPGGLYRAKKKRLACGKCSVQPPEGL